MKPAVWAAVCGAVRDELDVRLILDYLLRCRQQGTIQGIVFSTWQGELEKEPGIERLLETNDVIIVKTRSIDQAVGNLQANVVNYWRQALQLQRALEVIPADAIVLKTRTDRAMPPTRRLIEMLADEDPLPLVSNVKKQENLNGFPEVFEHQVAAFRPRTNRVFQFTDFAFMGYSRDLRKMLHFNQSGFLFSRFLNANMLFFIVTFVQDYPIIKDYERRIKYEALIPELDRYTSAGGIKFPEFLERFYAVYLGILTTHFRIGTISPKSLGQVGMPIAFSDFFHGTHAHHLGHSRLGTLINSSEVLKDFVEQPIESVDTTTQAVLRRMHGADASTFERASSHEVADLKAFTEDKNFSKESWLLDGRAIPAHQASVYSTSMAYKFPGISEEEQAELWSICSDVSSTDKVLLEFWLAHGILPADTPAYLSSGAKDGMALSILVMMRLLRKNYLDENDVEETLRVNNTQAKLGRQHRGGNIQMTCYVLNRVLYLQEIGETIPEELDLQVAYYLRRYMSGAKSDEVQTALYRHPEQLPQLFDELIAHSIEINKPVVHRRVIELALELTGKRKYWDLLEPLFTADEKLVRGVYEYSVKHDLLIQE